MTYAEREAKRKREYFLANREKINARERERYRRKMANETPEQRARRLERERERNRRRRAVSPEDRLLSATVDHFARGDGSRSGRFDVDLRRAEVLARMKKIPNGWRK